jgi:signal transduction histidine kinase
MDETLSRKLQDAVTRQAGANTFQTLEPLFDELWRERERQLPRDVKFTSAEAIGQAYQAHGQPASAAVEHVLLGGRALVELLEEAGALDPTGARRLQALVDEAAVQVAGGVEKVRRTRRGQWLSFLAHELKNPLNTILNALWLLRERGSDAKSAGRFVELAERAVKRIEARITDMRALDEHLQTAPPGWEALHGKATSAPSPPPGAEKTSE